MGRRTFKLYLKKTEEEPWLDGGTSCTKRAEWVRRQKCPIRGVHTNNPSPPIPHLDFNSLIGRVRDPERLSETLPHKGLHTKRITRIRYFTVIHNRSFLLPRMHQYISTLLDTVCFNLNHVWCPEESRNPHDYTQNVEHKSRTSRNRLNEDTDFEYQE